MLEGRKVLWVAGGRDFEDKYWARQVMATVQHDEQIEVLITGAARGADLLAEGIWREWQLPYVGIPAEWERYGKSAGYRRNVVIAEQGPDALLALPGDRGTQHARDIAREYGIPIVD